MTRRGWLIVLLLTSISVGLVWAMLIPGKPNELERAGEVPPGVPHGTAAGEKVWREAERTRWWGKPLDPRQFWRDRPIWYDASAQDEAQRHGRSYPPIPVHRTNLIVGFRTASLSPHKEKVGRPWEAGIDGGIVYPYHYTDAERDYWMWTLTTKLKPPAYLEALQLDELRPKKAYILQMREPPPHVKAATDVGRETVDGSRAQEIGMPAEALTDDALFWAYVMVQRKEYARWQAQWSQWAAITKRLPPASGFLDYPPALAILVTNTLTSDQIKAASAWKIDYLKRLLRVGVERTYIDAYLKAWDIAPAEVFPNAQKGAVNNALPAPNHSTEPTGASRFGHLKYAHQPRLAPAAHAQRSTTLPCL